ncbi:unnamed protein product [Clonostachys rosea]|uniref:Uncharacterized protein n=1 Tax=Bionectria ochroleuca TaxID=29856 RepID=A0ABY6TWR7_BIOOC|nr:unnamed protein product [Clonostachys rosea]
MPPKRQRAVVDLTEDDDNSGDHNRGPGGAKRQARSFPQQSQSSASSPSRNNLHVFESTLPSSSFSSTFPSSQVDQDPDVLDLTQEDDGPPRELYNTLDAKIVGVRYYNGYASAGEVVLCRREPTNMKHDRNAIRVENVVGQQIGHLPRKVVEKLAPFIDRGDLTVEAELTGEKEFYDCPVRLSFYGTSNPIERSRIEEALKREKLAKATQLKNSRKEAEQRRATLELKGGSSSYGLDDQKAKQDDSEISLDQLLQKSENVEFRKGGDVIKSIALSEEQLAAMPQADQPSELKSTLLPYQRQALAWLRAKENPSQPEAASQNVVQLWKRHANRPYWYNVATTFVTKTPPSLMSGGILADDMGLGKTLEIISLIVTGGPGTTLIVAPVSVMSNWEQQIRQHVLPDKQPSLLLYHGRDRMSAQALMKYDVVITSYGRLSQDKALTSQSVEWRRVVLDEGHTIRNAKTLVAMSACEVRAKSRWVLTGTPIVNSVKDLHSLVKFLHITGGIEQGEIFNTLIGRKLGSNDKGGEMLLQSLMQDICLRRKKDMKFVNVKLPEKKEFVHRITFHSEEKRKYDALLSEARGALAAYQSRSASQSARFQNVLERLLRLRQVCNHWTLCKERVEDLMNFIEKDEVVVLNDKNRALLQGALKLYMESQQECAICFEVPATPVITNCKHVFCRDCILKAIRLQHKCPLCRNALDEDSLLEPAPEESNDQDLDIETQSSKTESLVQIIRATLKNPGSKVIIFSQWTAFLNIVQGRLASLGYKYARVDGSMTPAKRDKAIHSLDHDDDTRIMLASLAVCSVGLNLVSADTVILCDSWWAPAVEDQAVDRVHRLGQTRETKIWRLVMEGTVEERVLDIQREKRQLVSKAFQENANKKKNKEQVTRMADVVKLLS